MQHRALIAQQVSILLAATGAHKMEADIVGWVPREISDSAGRSTLWPLTLPFLLFGMWMRWLEVQQSSWSHGQPLGWKSLTSLKPAVSVPVAYL